MSANDMQCPCGSGVSYDACCNRHISGAVPAPTAEALMRSRYTAYTRCDIDYIERTHAPETRGAFDASAARDWAMRSRWLGLDIVSTEAGRADEDSGVVSFAATYEQAGQTIVHREVSRFRKDASGEWLYVDGRAPASAKVGRNDPCPCGSGKKFKKCCGA